jgi:hydrogenase/urease accessory protein HupE
MTVRRAWLVLLSVWLCGPAIADEVRPGLLELTETTAGQFEVLWKVPALGDLALGIHPALSADCRQLIPPSARIIGSAQYTSWTVDCGPDALKGTEIRIDGLNATTVDVLVRVQFSSGTVISRILRPGDVAFVVDASGSAPLTWDYLRFGFDHILGGLDHLLFVLGLLLIVRDRWLLLKTITAFTVAHSVTLGLATLDVVHVPQAPVEAVIALSIVFVASELVRRREGQPDLMERAPWTVAFTFGLLHGFGFAGALAEVGLPQADIPVALLLFNVGVELGQLAFVGAVLSLIWLVQRAVGPTPQWLPRAAAYGIGTVAAYWVFVRTLGMVTAA